MHRVGDISFNFLKSLCSVSRDVYKLLRSSYHSRGTSLKMTDRAEHERLWGFSKMHSAEAVEVVVMFRFSFNTAPLHQMRVLRVPSLLVCVYFPKVITDKPLNPNHVISRRMDNPDFINKTVICIGRSRLLIV